MPKHPKRDARPWHDASYKRFFSRQRTVADTLRATTHDLAERLDFSTLERLPASFVTERLGQRHADMLWRIRTPENGWLYLLVLLEFQSTIDRRMALRMMDYTVRILRALDKEDLGPGGEHPPILPVVVYNGERRWTAPTDVRDLFAHVPRELLGYLPRHRYLLIEVRTLDPSRLPADNVLSVIARFEQTSSTEQVEELASSLAAWLEQVGDPKLVEGFGAWVDLVLAQRFATAGREIELRLRKDEEAKMTTLVERARKWGQERDQRWLERGRLEGERDLVLRMVTRRFGPGAADDLAPVLEGVSNPDRIAAIAARVFECETAEELVAWAQEA